MEFKHILPSDYALAIIDLKSLNTSHAILEKVVQCKFLSYSESKWLKV